MDLTQAQQKKYSRILEDAQDLMSRGGNGGQVLTETIKVAAPSFMGVMNGKMPTLEILQYVVTRLLAVLLASTQDNATTHTMMQNFKPE